MNILLLNGSPRGQASNTLRLARAFVEGMNRRGEHHVDEVTIAQRDIRPCTGCFGCWGHTPGKCVQRDDMDALEPLRRKAEVVIWCMPLYYFGMPSGIKAFLDRQMPNNQPSMVTVVGGGERHPQRHDHSGQRHLLLSTCGFSHIENNYEALVKQFETLFRGEAVCITCPQGGVFGDARPSRPVRERLEQLRRAGADYAEGMLGEEAVQTLCRPVFDPEEYRAAVNMVWGRAASQPDEARCQPESPAARALLEELVARFTPQTAGDDRQVVELYFPDLGNTFQLRIADGACVLAGAGAPWTLRLELPFPLWRRLAAGDERLTRAFLDKQMQLWGDFNTLLRLDDFFPLQV